MNRKEGGSRDTSRHRVDHPKGPNDVDELESRSLVGGREDDDEGDEEVDASNNHLSKYDSRDEL